MLLQVRRHAATETVERVFIELAGVLPAMNFQLFAGTHSLKFNAASRLRQALKAQRQQDRARQHFLQLHTNILHCVEAAEGYSGLTKPFIATRLLQVLATRLLSITMDGL